MTDSDRLPAIGAPATRALAAIGVTRLEQLQQHRAEDLLALHGIGPKAIRVLQAALDEQGVAFAGARDIPPEVEAYIDALDAPHRRLFDHLHRLILDELPEAEVVFSYQIPMYKAGTSGTSRVGLSAHRAGAWTAFVILLPVAVCPIRPSVGCAASAHPTLGSRIQEHAGVHDAAGVDGVLGRAQRGGEQLRALAVVLRTVHPADGVVVGDRPAGVEHRLAGGRLDLGPLRQLRTLLTHPEPRVIRRRPVGVDVSEAARQLGGRPEDLPQCARDPLPHGGVECSASGPT